jgi:hypothetical protein
MKKMRSNEGVATASAKLGAKLLCSFLIKLQHIKLSSAYPALRWVWQWKYICLETVACAFIEAHPLYMFLS